MEQQRALEESWSEPDRTSAWTARPPAAFQPASRSVRQDVLTRAFADEVIPRLLSARRPTPQGGLVETRQAVTAGHIEALLALILGGTRQQAAEHVSALRDRGMPADTILLDLLAPVARQLGQMWEDDTCTFSDVTVGLGHLSHVMRTLDTTSNRAAPLEAGPSALLVQMPGEQHGFGLAMVVHFFREGGWRVSHAPLATSAELVGLVRKNWYGILGVSVACSDRMDALAGYIRAIRGQSRNCNIGVMVGGPPFLAHPQLAELVGADATAVDAEQALREANRLVGVRAAGR